MKASPRDAATMAGLEGARFVETVLFAPDMEDLEATASCYAGLETLVHVPFTVAGGGEVDVASRDRALREASLEAWDRSFRLAERLDARYVILHPGGIVRRAEAQGAEAGVLRADSMERFEDALRRTAEAHGPDRILVENMPDHYHRTDGTTDRCLLGRGWADLLPWRDLIAGLCLDVSHAWLTGGRGKTLETFVRRGGPWIRHLHLSDAQPPEGEGLPLGAGEIPWATLLPALEALESAGRTLTAVPEVKGGHAVGGAGFQQALRFLRARLS